MSAENTNDTLLAVDIGTTATRALLFDVVENSYRLVGYGEAPSTAAPPYAEASEGMRHALLELQAITGRALLDENARLIMPATSDGRGADACAVTASAGPAVRTLLVGLLPDVSLASARRLAGTGYLSVVDSLSLGDRRGEDGQIEAVLAARPDLILIAGGTDGGAGAALLKLVETVALGCHLLPGERRAKALFVGNAAQAERVAELLGNVAAVHTAPNVQPALGSERLEPARAELSRLYEELRVEQLGGFADLTLAAGGRILPTAQAAGLFARFLSRLPAWQRGVLLADAGSGSAYLAAAWNGRLHLTVSPEAGLGAGAAAWLTRPEADAELEAMARWLPEDVALDALREFLLNKAAHPHTIPATSEDLHLEHALARHVLRAALQRARADWPAAATGPRGDLLPGFGLILGGGAVLGQSPRPGLAALLLLDALQPTGLTRLLLDPYHLAPALGATAQFSPLAVAQVYDSLAFVELGTAASLSGPAGRGAEVACEVRLLPEGAAEGKPTGGGEQRVEVRAGTLAVLPLPLGQTAQLTLRPRPGWNAGFGAGRGRSVTVQGGALGVIVDARGRPINLPRPADKRREALAQWIEQAGGR
jgi:hypothetical protein